jgi:amino acid adenylation domain-containing protein
VTTDVLTAVLGHATDHPDRPAVKDPATDLDYAALVGRAGRVAAGLVARGVTEGDRVALLLPNSAEFVVAALACLWSGAIFVPLAVTDPAARLAAIVADCAPALVVHSGTADGGDVPGDGPHPFALATVAELAGTGAEPPSPADGERTAYAIYTSGTTGQPKGVLIGTAAFAAAVDAAAAALGLDADTRTLCVSPFHFDGSFGTLFPALHSGGAVVIRPRDALLFPRTFFRAVRSEGITYTGFSPTYLRLLLSSPEMRTLADSDLSVVALGGEACSAADIAALWEVAPRVRVFNRYGPTETTIAVTHLAVTLAMVESGTVPIGRPHPGVSFTLLDGDGRPVDTAGTVGELYIGGSQLMDGYWGAPELTAAVLRTDVVPGSTVYRSGDLVYRGADGEYVYVDRADRVIKRRGIRISLVEITDAVRAADGVTVAACVAFDDDGQVGIVAFVVGERPLVPLELRRDVGAGLPESMLPDRFVQVEDLPLTGSSKLDERRLLASAGLAGVGATAAADTNTAG